MRSKTLPILPIAVIGAICGSSSQAVGMWPSVEACVRSQIALLDDGISSADVIAAGVALKCREVLAQSCRCDGERLGNAVAVIKTETLPYVLEYRASKRPPR